MVLLGKGCPGVSPSAAYCARIAGRNLGSGRNRDECAAEVAAVGAGQGNRLVERLPLNQAAPFHVVEEESGVALPEGNLTAELKP